MNRQGKANILFWAVLFLLCLTYTLKTALGPAVLVQSGGDEPGGPRPCIEWLKWKEDTRDCLLAHFGRRPAWSEFTAIVASCVSEYTRSVLGVRHLRNNDDDKLAVLSNATKESCLVVSLGVGNDTLSEHQLRQLEPDCVFHGADPVREVGAIYSQLGRYFEVAVGPESGVFEASVLRGPGIFDYETRRVKTVSFVEFLKEMVGASVIDHLWLDNEGPEYQLLPQLLRNGAATKSGVLVCQLNVEFHGPPGNYGTNESHFQRLMMQIIADSSFLPVWAFGPMRHARAFFINVENRYCAGKYFTGRYCSLPSGK